MKYTEIEKYVKKHNLLTKNVSDESGIYGITVDGIIVYIGQSKDVKRRCEQHIYNIQNAIFMDDYKYRLLFSAQLGGHKVDCVGLDYVDEIDLLNSEALHIQYLQPPLNIYKNHKTAQDIFNMKIEDLIGYVNNEIRRVNEELGITAETANTSTSSTIGGN